MKPTIVKLVDEILRRIAEHPETPATEHGIRTWLTQEGFSKRDIEDAIELIRPRFMHRVEEADRYPLSVRKLTGEELFKLTPEARDALARLETYGMIDAYERELILERLSHFDGDVGMDELDYLLSWLVCGVRDAETQRAIYAVFEGRNRLTH